MDIHIHTQYRENCGDESQPYWKFKGGSTIVVTNFGHPLTDGIAAAALAVVERVCASIEYRNPMSEEYIIDWELVETGIQTEDERLQQEYDGRINYPSKRLHLTASGEVAATSGEQR